MLIPFGPLEPVKRVRVSAWRVRVVRMSVSMVFMVCSLWCVSFIGRDFSGECWVVG